MAAATAVTTATSSQLFQSRDNFYNDYDVDDNGCSAKANRQEIQAAIAKAVELRALHAALMQGSSPTTFRFPSPSPASASQFSSQDYPIFTPSYEEEPLPGYQQVSMKSQTPSESGDDYGVGRGNGGYAANLSDYKENSSLRSGLALNLINVNPHICPADNDHKSVSGSSANHFTVLQSSPGNEYFKSASGQNFGDFQSVSSCNRCKPAIITKESETAGKHNKNSNTIVQITDPQASVQSQSRNRGVISWLFPRSKKKKNRNENSPNRTESENVSQIFKDLGILSIEMLKKELIAANEAQDAALVEVAEMKSSFEELKQKMEYLETYCEELKRALRQATTVKNAQAVEKLGKFRNGGKLNNGSGENSMPVSEEVMVEGFLQVVSEARLAVKQFCKTLVGQIEETDTTLMKNLNLLLQPHKLSVNSKYSKAVLYHLEAIINQSLFQDYENCAFQKNGSPKDLDPRLDRQAQFSAFVALRNLGWNEILLKGTKYYSDELSKFCDQKMSSIIATLNWTRPWHEQLLQAFFVAAKCIWLLHLLAFSFDPPLQILRVEENRSFDSQYMEDVFVEKQKSNGPGRVKIMVTPGFYVHERVLRCKVICRYKSVSSSV